jgi:triphosphoribosyl-dephospho-CoA synthetase
LIYVGKADGEVLMVELQVGYIWLHEAARELSDELPMEIGRKLRRELVDHAAAAFSSFNEGVVTHPPRCKGMTRVEWASLLVESSEMDVWQLSPVDLAAVHAEITKATDSKLVYYIYA